MSAFLVDPTTIGILAAYAEKHNLLGYAPCHTITAYDAVTAAQTLAKCNIESVEHRYPGSNAAQDYMGITRNDYIAFCVQESGKPLPKLSIVQIAKHCDCLDYQSCEIDSWYDSDGYKILTAIRNKLLKQLPDYELAEWG